MTGSATTGGRATALLRQLLDRRLEGQAPTESALEDAIVGVLRAYRLPEPQRQYAVALPGGAVLRLDLAYPRARLGIEGDGRIWHSSRQDFLRDRVRTNRLATCGWRLLRFGWADVRERSGDVAATVAGVLRAEGA